MLNVTNAQIRAIELSDVGGDEYVAFVNERAFSVGPLLYQIIRWLQQDWSITKITARINETKGASFSENELTELVNDNFGRLGVTVSDDHTPLKRRSEYIYGQVSLMGEEMVAKLSAPLNGLFNPAIFKPLALLGVAVTCLFYYNYGTWVGEQVYGAPLQVFIIYCALGLIFFAHEIGHTAAANRYGVKAKKVGFGFYFIFPVFFTDVTRVYGLPKRKRIIVNLGGIYFQLIINTALIGLWYLLPWSALPFKVALSLLVSTNTFVLLYSLNPFFRNDGYWIYSDLFNVKNMLVRGYRYPFLLISQIYKGEFRARDLEWPLLFFALANFVFLGTFVGAFVTSFGTLNAQLFKSLSKPSLWVEITENTGFYLKCLIFYGIIGLLFQRYIKVFLSRLQRYRQRA